MGLIVAGAASTGGLAALAVRVSRKKNGAVEIVPNSSKRRNQDVNERDRKPENKSGSIFHTYSCYARGTEGVLNTYNYLDLVPKGRDEDSLPFTMSWVRHWRR